MSDEILRYGSITGIESWWTAGTDSNYTCFTLIVLKEGPCYVIILPTTLLFHWLFLRFLAQISAPWRWNLTRHTWPSPHQKFTLSNQITHLFVAPVNDITGKRVSGHNQTRHLLFTALLSSIKYSQQQTVFTTGLPNHGREGPASSPWGSDHQGRPKAVRQTNHHGLRIHFKE